MTPPNHKTQWNPCERCLEPLANAMEEWISPLRSSLNHFFDEPPDDHVWINAGRLSDLYHSYDVSRCVRWLKINMSSDVSREFEHALAKHDVDMVEIDTWDALYGESFSDTVSKSYMHVIRDMIATVTFIRELSESIRLRYPHEACALGGESDNEGQGVSKAEKKTRSKTMTRDEAEPLVMEQLNLNHKTSAQDIAELRGAMISVYCSLNSSRLELTCLKLLSSERAA